MSDPLALVIAACALFVGGAIKGAIGMGLPLVAIPVLATLYSVPIAIAIMVIPLAISNLWQMWAFRGAKEGRRALRPMLVGCGVGVVLGTFLLGLLADHWLSLLLAGLVLFYLVLRLAKPDMAITEARAVSAALPMGLVTGILQGAAGISSPLGVTFIHAQRLGREAHIFSLAAMFTVLAAVQTLSLSAYGLMTLTLAVGSIACLVPIFLGVFVGQALGRHWSHTLFERITLGILTVTAATLIWRALPHLFA